MKTYRIKTKPIEDSDKYISVNVDQTFDELEVLSLKLNSKNTYTIDTADFGVVVGRCYMNNGLGIPNVRVSLFIPLKDSDKLNQEVFSMYPYETVNSLDSNLQRYNLLPDEQNGDCHLPVGRFPKKNAILDNNELSDVYSKYYRFTTETNSAGDYMFYGIPLGSYTIIVDCDISDIGIYSQRPYDMVENGSSPSMFDSMTQYKSSGNINLMPQILHRRNSVHVYPFWGNTEDNTIGISRCDIDLGYTLEPKAIFMGSIFGDNEKNSVNKNCIPRRDLGNICETVSSQGTIEMIRENTNGGIETFNINGGDLIDSNGNWAYRVPMNLDYMITSEDGKLIPTEDKTKGIPTRAKVRFRIGLDDTGGEGRIRTRAKFLVPHNPSNEQEVDYEFNNTTNPNSMYDMFWNKIYTIKQFVPRVQHQCNSLMCVKSRRMVAIKDVDSCVGSKNPFPYNKINGNFNPLFTVLCLITGLIVFIVHFINNIIITTINKITKILRRFGVRAIKCITLTCNEQLYAPGCGREGRSSSTNTNRNDVEECFKQQLAEAIRIYTFDFYNDWVNGSLYSFLLKYKLKRDGDKFCSADSSKKSVLVNTIYEKNTSVVGYNNYTSANLNKGYVKRHIDGNLYYVPYVPQTNKLFATDIYELGAIFDCDWQAKPKINNLLIPTTYQMPPKINEEEGVTEYANDLRFAGLLFGFSCVKIDMDTKQVRNMNRICEIGIGLDEDREYDNTTADRILDKKDIESKFLRDSLIYLNSENVNPNNNIGSGFGESHYNIYRDKSTSNTHPLGYHMGNSLYFYFGTEVGNTALELMNKKYFTRCFPNKPVTFNIIGDVVNVTTIGGNNGSIEIEIDGGVYPYTYEWSNGEITKKIENLQAGNYIVKVTDANGTISTKVFQVLEPQSLDFVIEGRDPLITNTANGWLKVTSIYGGNTPYTVKLTGTQIQTHNNINVSGTTFNNLGKGSYTITVTDTSGQSTSKPYILYDPNPLTIETTKHDNICINGDDGEISLLITSGNPPYLFKTTSPDVTMTEVVDGVESEVPYLNTTDNLVNLKTGTYNVNVRDSISLGLEEINSTNPRRYGVTKTITIGQPSGVLDVQKVRIEGMFTILMIGEIHPESTPSDYTLMRNKVLQYDCQLITYNGEPRIGYTFSSEPDNSSEFYIITYEGCETKRTIKLSSD